MLVGIFLLCLLAFVAALYAIQWLFAAMAGLTGVSSAEFFVALGGMAAITILIRYGLGGLVMAVTLLVFWSVVLFGTAGNNLAMTLMVAALVLYAGAAATVVETHLGDDGT